MNNLKRIRHRYSPPILKSKSFWSKIPTFAKVLADIGTFIIGVAAIWGLSKANDTFDKIGQLSASMNEVRSLSMDIRATLGLVRNEIKLTAVKTSSAKIALEDAALTDSKARAWLDTVPRTWGEAIRKKSPFFITSENRGGLIETILNQQPKSRLAIVESASMQTARRMTARFQIFKSEMGHSNDTYNLFSGGGGQMGSQWAKLADEYQDSSISCKCNFVSGEKSNCTYDSQTYKVIFPPVESRTEFDVTCGLK
jgi:hypothetical protein